MGITSWLAVLCVVLMLSSSHAGADEQAVKLKVSTNRCVALHQGQTCYQKLLFTWQTPSTGEFCLIELPETKFLVCWEGEEKSSFKFNFESASGVTYQIRDAKHEDVLAAVEVTVAWVYRSERKSSSGWRIF